MAAPSNISANVIDRPSIFELVAAQSLDSTFYPAFKKIALYIGARNPEKFAVIVKYYDELFLILNGAVQQYYLRKYCSSISETFYGLGRYNLKTFRFGKRDFFVSFAFLVIVPYLFRKLESHMNRVKEKLQDELTIEDKYKVLGLYSYRVAKSTYEFTQIIKYITYLSNRSKTHNLPLFLSSISLKHGNPHQETFSFIDIIKGNVRLSTVLGTTILRTLEFGGFFLQFLQWYQGSSASQKIILQLPTPDPPTLDRNATKFSNICPICYQSFVIPTTLSTSGYTFCYKCITKHLNKKPYCPVTNLPAIIDDLVRIYDN
ncbi:unnamed protein product [Chironomus riparius]|uniref:Peroxisome assembly protein 12 n=1 Tax=Chironomus riparius TaxID=315576 RepID=A0A9N9RQS5_9DIPT|nr:unnamed protein product [Chironomus riparius]